MITVFALHFTNLLFAGVLAGSEIGIHHGVGAPPLAVGDIANIQIRQAAGKRLRILIPALFFVAVVTSVTLAFWTGAVHYAWLRWAALICLALWIATRVLVTVPVNSAVLDWAAASPPTGWKNRLALAERFHIIGVWASFLAFACLLAADLLT